MAEAPLLHKVPSLIGWPGSPSILITWSLRVETTCPQPTPQNGQTVVVFVAPRLLSAGTAGPHPDSARAPTATAPVVNPLRNWRRVGCGGEVLAASPDALNLFSSSLFILVLTGRD